MITQQSQRCSHFLAPDVGLETNITDIANVLKWEDLTDVILVAASYAGMVTTCVADRMPEPAREYLERVLQRAPDHTVARRMLREM